jgi:hypothetical protein
MDLKPISQFNSQLAIEISLVVLQSVSTSTYQKPVFKIEVVTDSNSVAGQKFVV